MTGELGFFEGLQSLDEILAEHEYAPTALDGLTDLLRDQDLRREFFKRLARADWVEPLRMQGYFDHPPAPQETPSGGLQHPFWPAGDYLVRMAAEAPIQVAQVLQNIETANIQVVGNLIDAALAMPPVHAASLVSGLISAAQDGTVWIHLKDASEVCVRLASGGEPDPALALAQALFAPMPGEKEDDVARRDSYWYEQGLDRVIPALVGVRPTDFVRAMCRWLRELIGQEEITLRSPEDDASYWWRPAVEEHEQNQESTIRSILVGGIRQALEEGIRQDGLSLDAALSILTEAEYLIFRRIRIHLVKVFADEAPELARRFMMNREFFDDFRYKHEYAMLVGQRLDLLTPEERETWFSWVDAGPDMSDFAERFRAMSGRDPTEEERANRRQYWRFEKLHCVRNFLAGPEREFYERMFSEHGEPELADLNARISSGWYGAQSPMTVDELSGLTLEQLLVRVCDWRPEDDDPLGPNEEGLAATFGEVVGSNAGAYSAHAMSLRDRPAIYVRTYLSQMIAAAKADKEIDVLAVLDLCRWVAGHSREERATPSPKPHGLVDMDWQWTRSEVARFILSVVEARSEGNPTHSTKELRTSVWSVIEGLCSDLRGESEVEDGHEHDPRIYDYLTESLNSPPGQAVEAVLEYARWVATQTENSEESNERVPGGFKSMPEVGRLLDRLLTSESRTPLTHALIGSRVGLIYWIDSDWLERHAPVLFDLRGVLEDPTVRAGWAAWNAFLVWVRPHIEYYRLFEEQYRYAVGQSALVEPTEASREDPMVHLGEHLMILYGRGQLALEDGEGVVLRFVLESSPVYRRHAMEFVGRVLVTEKDLGREFVDRYRVLWERYWTAVGKRDALEDPDALAFGYWITSGRFPRGWALDHLKEFVEVVPIPEPDRQVAEYLAEASRTEPIAALEILDRMVRADREGWRVQAWIDPVRTVLTEGLARGGDARTSSEALIDYLGRKGFTSLGELVGVSTG